MFCFRSSISVCKLFGIPTNMASPSGSADACSNSRQNHQLHRNRKQPNSPISPKLPPCHRPGTAIDVVILIAVIGALVFLIFPYVKLFYDGIIEIGEITLSVIGGELSRSPTVYASVGLGIFFSIVAIWGISKCMTRKCGKPNCRGLRKAAEFDIQLETEECVKNSSPFVNDGVGKRFFELAKDHHRELEAELKKIAPPNGRAVLVFRGRCGCLIGRMEVLAPKRPRKIKK